jgi:hypothetical protein
MTESKSENYSNLPLPLTGINKDSFSPKTQTPLSIPTEEVPRTSERISKTAIIPGMLTPQETQKLADLETDFMRLDNAGSIPTAPIAEEIAQLSAKQAGYSLEEQRFAPGSVRMNLDPIGITEAGQPVYPWISGETGRELREEGVLMKEPEWHKKMARNNKRIRTKNAL